MTYTIQKEFAFSASHVLLDLPEGHPCGRLHGHNYVVRVILSGEELDSVGFLFDYGNLGPLKDYVDAHLDHRHLNDRLNENPTAEHLATNLARAFYALLDLPEGVAMAVGVSETPKTWAWWTP